MAGWIRAFGTAEVRGMAVAVQPRVPVRLATTNLSSRARLDNIWRLARRKPLGAIALVFIVLLVLVAIFANVLATPDASTRPDSTMVGANPGAVARNGTTYLLGGDELGRDLFARVVYGARISVTVSLSAVAIGVAIGTLLGVASGYLGGWWDLVVQRVMDSQQSVPALLMAMLLVSVFKPSVSIVIIALGLNLIPGVNRVVRGSAISVSHNEYIAAARSVGAGTGRIMLRHVLPNVTAPIIVIATTGLGTVILAEASLSFLGFGIPA